MNTRVAFSLSRDSRMINAIDSSDNFFFPFSLFPLLSPSLFTDEAARIKRVHCSRSRCVCSSRAQLSLLASSERIFFCSNEPCFSFHGEGSRFLHLSLMKKFEYSFPAERKFLYLFFLLNLLHANPLSFGKKKGFFCFMKLFELT